MKNELSRINVSSANYLGYEILCEGKMEASGKIEMNSKYDEITLYFKSKKNNGVMIVIKGKGEDLLAKKFILNKKIRR